MQLNLAKLQIHLNARLKTLRKICKLSCSRLDFYLCVKCVMQFYGRFLQLSRITFSCDHGGQTKWKRKREREREGVHLFTLNYHFSKICGLPCANIHSIVVEFILRARKPGCYYCINLFKEGMNHFTYLLISLIIV